MNRVSLFLVGLIIGVSGSVYANTILSVEADQEIANKLTGDYFSDVSNPQFTINTYETICKGYYIIEDKGTAVVVTGFGPLASEFTYSYDKPVQKIDIATSTIDTISDVLGVY